MEPSGTALILLAVGLLLVLSVLSSRISGRIGVPFALAFLVIGMLAGSEGLGGLHFEDYGLAFRLGTTALVLIIFDGGLNTSVRTLRLAVGPAAVLSTLGVVLTAALAAGVAFLIGLPWPEAALLGAVVSSTDAAAVFAVLRGSGLSLSRRLAAMLELEAGSNDPMAFVLTATLTGLMVGTVEPGWGLAVQVPLQLVLGVVLGLALGWVGVFVLRRLRLPAGGLFPVMSVALALVSFGAPTLVGGSGFLAVYVAGVVIGNARLPFRPGILRVQDALAWLSQVGMFLVLGLLVFPSRLLEVAVPGLVLAAALTFVVRPLVALLTLAPFRLPWREVGYLGWVGLRGAVPIILATYPILMGASGGHRIFDLVFFVVVVNSLIPGATVPALTRWLGLQSAEPPAPPAAVEINTMTDLGGEVVWYTVDKAAAVAGARLADVPFPRDALALLLFRDNRLMAPRGDTVLCPGDHVWVFCRPEDVGFVALLFGRTG